MGTERIDGVARVVAATAGRRGVAKALGGAALAAAGLGLGRATTAAAVGAEDRERRCKNRCEDRCEDRRRPNQCERRCKRRCEDRND